MPGRESQKLIDRTRNGLRLREGTMQGGYGQQQPYQGERQMYGGQPPYGEQRPYGGYGQPPYPQGYPQTPFNPRSSGRRVVRILLRVAGIIFMCVGLLMLPVSGCVRSAADGLAEARTAETTGTVVRIDERTTTDSDGDRHTSRYPVLRFEDGDHVQHEETQTVSTRTYQIGETVTVKYDPHNPSGNFMIAGDEGFVQGAFMIFVVMGGVFALIGTIFLIVSFAIRK